MAVLPTFTSDGLLPPADYELTVDELRESLLVMGPDADYPNWDVVWRRLLVDNLGILVKQLWQVGVREIFADGSFVEDKEHPNDIDGYFVCNLRELASGELERKLNPLTRTRSGRGTRHSAVHTAGFRRSSFRCGTSTASSFTRTSGSFPASAIDSAMSLSSRRRSGSPDATASLAGSSRLEEHHDPQ